MKRIPAALALLSLAPLAACGRGGVGSAVRFERDHLDLGRLHQWDEVPFSMPFRIEGDAPVLLTAVEVSCGCTDVSVVVNGQVVLSAEKKPGTGHGAAEDDQEDPGLLAEAGGREILIQPGETGEVRGRYQPERRLNEQVVAISLRGDMLNSPARAELRAFVLPLFVLDPPRLHFGTQVDDELAAAPVSLELGVRAPRKFELRGWTRVPPGLRVEDLGESLDAEGAVRKFRFTLEPGTGLGTVESLVVAGTDLGPDLSVLVSWRVVGPVTYAPETRVNFLKVPRGREHVRTVKLLPSKPGRAIPEPRAELTGEVAGLVRVEVERLAEEDGWAVRCVLPADAPAGAGTGTLRISYPGGAGPADHELSVHVRVEEPR